MKIYDTKHALTSGIVVREVTPCSNNNTVSFKGLYFTEHLHGEGKEWHKTAESAIARAEMMRDKKIASLKKKLAQLENMTFEVSEDEQY